MRQFVRKVNISYAVLQTFYIASNSVLFGFAVVLLQSRGFSNTQIGIALAVSSVLQVFFQPALAAFMERMRRLSLNAAIAAVMLLTLVLCFVLFVTRSPLVLVFVIFVLAGAFAVLPQAMIGALAMEFENSGTPILYGVARGCGSLGYAVMGYFMGRVIERFGAGSILIVYMVMLATTILLTLLHPKVPREQRAVAAKEKEEPVRISAVLRQNRTLLCFFIAVIAICYNHGLLDSYQVSIVQAVGGSTADYGTVMFVMALSELPVMFLYNGIKKKISVATLMSIAYIAFIAKVGILLLAEDVEAVIAAQLCNAFTLGLYLPSIVYFTNMITNRRETVVAQSLIGGTAFGVGRVAGNLMGGSLLDIGGVGAMLVSCIVVAAAGFILMRVSNSMYQKKIYAI